MIELELTALQLKLDFHHVLQPACISHLCNMSHMTHTRTCMYILHMAHICHIHVTTCHIFPTNPSFPSEVYWELIIQGCSRTPKWQLEPPLKCGTCRNISELRRKFENHIEIYNTSKSPTAYRLLIDDRIWNSIRFSLRKTDCRDNGTIVDL